MLRKGLALRSRLMLAEPKRGFRALSSTVHSARRESSRIVKQNLDIRILEERGSGPPQVAAARVEAFDPDTALHSGLTRRTHPVPCCGHQRCRYSQQLEADSVGIVHYYLLAVEVPRTCSPDPRGYPRDCFPLDGWHWEQQLADLPLEALLREQEGAGCGLFVPAGSTHCHRRQFGG
jgi:hypothetical protein